MFHGKHCLKIFVNIDEITGKADRNMTENVEKGIIGAKNRRKYVRQIVRSNKKARAYRITVFARAARQFFRNICQNLS